MEIKGFISESFQDYDKGMACVIFTGGCNYRCPACHGKGLLENEETSDGNKIINAIIRKKDYLNKVVISGGEPTLEPDLITFLEKLKQNGLDVKLDTNGSNPRVLEEILKRGLADYVAMDVKGPKNLYPFLTNRQVNIADIEWSIQLLSGFSRDYEFRTTVVPVIKYDGDKKLAPEFMNVADMEDMAKWIIETTGRNDHKLYLQGFVARDNEEMMDPLLSKENLPPEMRQTPRKLLDEMLATISKQLPNTKVR